MPAEVMPGTGSIPRQARYLFPLRYSRRGEAMAACALLIALAHVLLAQLTLGLAVTFTLTGRATRWQPWWLLGPAVVGVLWTLAEGPGAALDGFTRGPADVLGYLRGGPLAGRLDHPLAAFAGVGRWLPAQAPLALIYAAAEAAAMYWLDWLHTDEWAVRAARPGPVAAIRRLLASRLIRGGRVLTREGCALGIVPATGALAELRWAELADGALVVGADPTEVAVTCLQVVHAALRRRKPLIVLDGGGNANVAAALAAACQATGTPLWRGQAALSAAQRKSAGGDGSDTAASDTATAGASQLWGGGRGAAGRPRTSRPGTGPLETTQPAPGPDGLLSEVIRERRAALLALDSPELIARAGTELAAATAQLRRIGVAGDALVWVPEGARLPAQTLAAMIRDGGAVGLPVLVGTTSPKAAAAIAALAGTVLIHRVADPELAASLAVRAGTWLLPASALSAPASGISAAGPDSGTAVAASPSGLFARPRVSARALLTLGPARFVLAVNAPRPRLVTGGRMVRARLPVAGRQQRTSP